MSTAAPTSSKLSGETTAVSLDAASAIINKTPLHLRSPIYLINVLAKNQSPLFVMAKLGSCYGTLPALHYSRGIPPGHHDLNFHSISY